MGGVKSLLLEQEEWADMMEPDYEPDAPPDYVERKPRPTRTKRAEKELNDLMKKHLIGKKSVDLYYFNDKERHFLFTMRMYYLEDRWDMTEKQEKWFRQLLDR